MQGLYFSVDAPWRSDFESELLRFPAAVHDDQVDALGLIGQLLDHINAPVLKQPKPKRTGPRDWFDEPDTDTVDWKTA